MKPDEQQIKDTYNKLAEFYHDYRTSKSKGGWFFNEYLEMPGMLNALGKVKGKKILDWGCGSGIYAKILTKKGAIVKGFDISKEMIKIAKKENPCVDLKVGSGMDIPFTEQFDIVFASLALHYLEDWDQVLKEVRRVLKKEGLFLFSTDNPVTNSSKSIMYEKKKIKALGMRDYFSGEIHQSDWQLPNGEKVAVRSFAKSYEETVKIILKNKFEIIDYVDLRPLSSAKKVFPEEYELWSKVPKFCIWKLRKR